MDLRFLRAVYAIEFLVALLAVLNVWREVGGQYHLDLMPWFVKLLLASGLASGIVKLTAAPVGQRRKILVWAGVVAMFVVGVALVTYYYHLNEPTADEDEESVLSTFLSYERTAAFRSRS